MSTLVPQGRYKARVINQGFTVAKNTANQGFWLEWEVFDADDSPQPIRRTTYWYFTEKTVDNIIEKLGRMGYVPQSFREIDPLRDGHHSYVGEERDLRCEHETWKGKEREKWDLAGGGAPPPATEDQMAKLEGMFGHQLKKASVGQQGTKRSAPAVPPDKAQPSTGEAPPDDIPF